MINKNKAESTDDMNRSVDSNLSLEVLFRVFNDENDVTVTDDQGVILRVSDTYEAHYGVPSQYVIGKTVYEMEEEGIFYPSVSAAVLKLKRKATLLQKNKAGRTILTTGVPIFDESNNIKYVISFNAIDIADISMTQDKYDKLKDVLTHYNGKLNKWRHKGRKAFGSEMQSQNMRSISELIEQISDTEATVVLTGETGVGKSLAAQKLHRQSSRRGMPFIEINCATIPETLIETELFGYEGGAFTGANAKGRIGKIEMADGGTLFLDEIGELPLAMQTKFLHVIQEKKITRVGGTQSTDVDFRLIVATNRDLFRDVKAGLFREDLFYRLNVIPIIIPPLREHKEDIFPLINNFLETFNKKYKKSVSFSEEALAILDMQDWPGNIRQVENFVERMVITATEDLILPNQLPSEYSAASDVANVEITSLKQAVQEYERKLFVDLYKKHRTSTEVAKAAKISQSSAARKLRQYVPQYTERE